MISGTQKKIYDWMMKNFGQGVDTETLTKQQLAGIIEEYGELTHSLLKLNQNIRNDENHIAQIEDAIGDILVFGYNLLSLLNINVNIIWRRIENGEDYNTDNDIFMILFDINFLISELIELIYFKSCNNYGLDDCDVYPNENITDSFIQLFNILQVISKRYLEDKKIKSILGSVVKDVLKRDWIKERDEN